MLDEASANEMARESDQSPGRSERRDPMEANLNRIAERVKRWREEAGLTLKELAELAGVSASTVHKVENGQVSPTVSVLLRIAHGLQRHPGELVSLEEDEPSDYLLIQRSDRICVGNLEQSFVEKAAADLDNPQIDLWKATIHPGARSDHSICHDDGELIILCESGELTLWLQGEKMTLTVGDSIHCKAWVARRWENRGDVPVLLTVAVTVPKKAPMRTGEGVNAMWRHTVDHRRQQRRPQGEDIRVSN
jgi:transcriptional regulator with XRE-family HTH domain